MSQHQLSKQRNGNVYLLTQSQVMSAGLVIYREETKHDSSLLGRLTAFFLLLFPALSPTDGEPAERRGTTASNYFIMEILDYVIFVALFCLACMFPTRKEQCYILNGVACLLYNWELSQYYVINRAC